ncbi:hypothetical protein ACFL14_02955 [Patescibacteria group bacterium]
MSDQMSRMKALTPSNHTITFTTPSGIAVGETIEVEFPAGFSIPAGLDYTDMDLADDAVDLDLAAVCSGTTWGASKSGQIITLTSCTGAVAATSVVTIEIGTNAIYQTAGDQQITNPNTSGYSPQLNINGSMADSGIIGLDILSEDQVPVSGVLIPTLSFTFDTTPLNFGLLLGNSVAIAGPNTLVLATNSPLGYTITVRDIGNGSSAGLWNSTKNHLIPSTSGLLVAGANESYGGQCTRLSADGDCHTNFAFTGDNVGGFTRTNRVFASHGSQPAGAETYTITTKATVTSNTPSGGYLDRLTFTATAIY